VCHQPKVDDQKPTAEIAAKERKKRGEAERGKFWLGSLHDIAGNPEVCNRLLNLERQRHHFFRVLAGSMFNSSILDR
jgi:hypothetical protein